MAKVIILWLNRLKNENFLHIEALWSTSLLKLVRVTKPDGQSGLRKLIRECIRSLKVILRAAFKFGRRVHFALRRKLLKPPIARLPAT